MDIGNWELKMGGKRYDTGRAKTGIGMGMDTASYKTSTYLSNVIVCCLDLDTLLVVLSCIVFKTLAEHFTKNCNYQTLICC